MKKQKLKKILATELARFDERLLEIENHLGLNIQEVEFEPNFDEVEKLPEKWFIRWSSAKEFKVIKAHFMPESEYWGYVKGAGVASDKYDDGDRWIMSNETNPKGYTEISFETFKRLVLKEVEKPVEFEVNKWYKSKKGKALVNYNGSDTGYGFLISGRWSDGVFIRSKDFWLPATNEEVKEALIKEAERRGFKEGVKFLNPDTGNKRTLVRFMYDSDLNALVSSTPDKEWDYSSNPHECSNPFIYERGKWAEIISEPEIDFSKAGQLVERGGFVAITSGLHTDKTFTGCLIPAKEKNIDYSQRYFTKEGFTLCTEPVTLKKFLTFILEV